MEMILLKDWLKENRRPAREWLKNGGPRKRTTGFILHSTAGEDTAGAIVTLIEKGLSYNYLIEKEGRVIKLIPSANRGFHAGSSYGWEQEARGVNRAQYANTPANRRAGRVGNFVAGCSVNDYTVGISFVHNNNGRTHLHDAQIKAATELLRELKTAFPQADRVSTHYGVSHPRKTDPDPCDSRAIASAAGLTYWPGLRND